MPWKECSVTQERLRFVARLLDGEGMSEVCRDFGISRKTGYAVGAVAPDSGAVDQAVAVEHRMHGAPGRQAHVAGKLANEQFADFARAPMRLVALEIDDQPHRPARAIGERLEPLIPIAIEDRRCRQAPIPTTCGAAAMSACT